MTSGGSYLIAWRCEESSHDIGKLTTKERRASLGVGTRHAKDGPPSYITQNLSSGSNLRKKTSVVRGCTEIFSMYQGHRNLVELKSFEK